MAKNILVHLLGSSQSPDADASLQSQYEYYSGDDNWLGTSSSPAAIFTLATGADLSSGDVFWSPLYETWMSIFMTSFQNEIYLIYSTTGNVQGPYTEPVLLFETCPSVHDTPPVACGNYAGSAYPFWRGSDASEVILSWSVNGGAETQMALVTFS